MQKTQAPSFMQRTKGSAEPKNELKNYAWERERRNWERTLKNQGPNYAEEQERKIWYAVGFCRMILGIKWDFCCSCTKKQFDS